ncbi:MAG: sugar ABC transporter permease [Ruminococcaceae bacterium]|nr:sugar ABC transporter permease [Oscillospiraceae bacterium]
MTNELKLNNVKKKRKKAASLDKKKARAGWIFVLPFIIGFVFIYFPIIFDSIKLSFYDINPLDSQNLMFVGWDNYSSALFENPDFVQVLVEGLGQMVFDIPAILIFSLFMAVLLNQKMAGRAFFRAILFVPVIISTGIMEYVAQQDVNNSYMSGGINTGEEKDGGGFVSLMDLNWLFGDSPALEPLMQFVTYMINNIFNIVNRSGVQMLIFLSGLQSISPAIYESCQIDGASAWETFWKITFPMISPMILVNAVYTIIDSFTTNSNMVMTHINKQYDNGELYISSAMSWIYFLIVIGIVAAVAGIFSMFVFYQRRND